MITPLHSLKGPARRRCMKLLRRLRDPKRFGCIFVRHEPEFREAERLHRAGLLTACASKWNWMGGRRPFRELALFVDESDARKQYKTVLPR